jgi:hypothetical protein
MVVAWASVLSPDRRVGFMSTTVVSGEVCTGVCTRRASVTAMSQTSRSVEPNAGNFVTQKGAYGLDDAVRLIDGSHRRIDLLPLVLKPDGDGWMKIDDDAWLRFPAEHMRATGVIAGRRVRCLSAELMGGSKTPGGSFTGEKTAHDLRVLAELPR